MRARRPMTSFKRVTYASVRTRKFSALAIGFVALFTALLTSAINVSAQTKADLPPECVKYLSYYQEDYKQKDYDLALVNWRKAYSACPKNASQNMYIHGTTLYTKLYNKTKDASTKQAIADTVLMLQDKRMAVYPAKRTSILNNKGGYIVNYKSSDQQYLYDNLGPIINELGSTSSESILVNYMKASTTLYKKGVLPKEDFITAFILVDSSFEGMAPANNDESEKREKARNVTVSLFSESGAASCESLQTLYAPKLSSDPQNISIASTILRLLGSVDDCVNNDLYMKAATTVHRNDPSYRSAYALYRMQSSKGNMEQAISYLEEACSLSTDGSEEKAKATLELAQLAYKEGLRSKAYAAARKATEMGPAYAGKAWLLIGNLWSSSRPEKELDKYAKLWAAADCYQRAKAADDSLKGEADSLTASVAKYYPAASDMFMYDLSSGQGYDVSIGGMYAHTTVRTRN